MGVFVISRRTNGEYHFNLKAINGQIILTSEGYVSKANCIQGIDAVVASSQRDDLYERKQSSNGKYYFTLRGNNGAILGVSELYESSSSRDNGIEAVKKNAVSKTVQDYSY